MHHGIGQMVGPLDIPTAPSITIIDKTLQWRIEGFPEAGALNHYLAILFSENCMKMNEIEPVGEGEHALPLGSAKESASVSVYEIF